MDNGKAYLKLESQIFETIEALGVERLKGILHDGTPHAHHVIESLRQRDLGTMTAKELLNIMYQGDLLKKLYASEGKGKTYSEAERLNDVIETLYRFMLAPHRKKAESLAIAKRGIQRTKFYSLKKPEDLKSLSIESFQILLEDLVIHSDEVDMVKTKRENEKISTLALKKVRGDVDPLDLI